MSGPGYTKPEPTSVCEVCRDSCVGKRVVNWCIKVEERKP